VGELRAYALGVAELRGVVGATGARAEQVRTLARQAYAPQVRPFAVRDLLGPIYRRVPGAPVLRTDDPTPADLETLLVGGPVPPARSAATWRLLEAVVAGLARSAVRLLDADLPAGLLSRTDLPLPSVEGLDVGWLPLAQAATVPALQSWLVGSEVWVREAALTGRPTPEVLVFST